MCVIASLLIYDNSGKPLQLIGEACTQNSRHYKKCLETAKSLPCSVTVEEE